MTDLIHISKTDLSDLFKDAHGFRPRGHYKEWWTRDELDAEYAHLSRICDENAFNEAIAEALALDKFEDLIKEVIGYGAGDRETAIRWLVQGENLDFTVYDLEYFFWGHGLSYKIQKEWSMKLAA